MAEPQPGDFVCVPISGPVGIGITIGQWLDGDRFQFYDHTEIYTGQADEAGPHGYTVSMYPGGHGKRALPCPPAQLPGSLWSSGLIELTPAQRAGIVAWALAHQDVSYSFMDYGALLLHALHIPFPGLRSYIKSTGHMICSWFVTADFMANGVQLFDDTRWEGYVKPGDLARLLEARLTALFTGLPATGRMPLLGSWGAGPLTCRRETPRHSPDPGAPAGSRYRNAPARPGDALMPEPKHRAPARRRPAYLASAAVASAAAISTAVVLPGGAPAAAQPPRLALDTGNDAHVLHVALPRTRPVLQAGPVTYRIEPGNTLIGIAREECGNPADFRALAVNNHIRYADQISAGDVLKVACHAAATLLARVRLEPPAPPAPPVRLVASVQGNVQPQAQQPEPGSAGGGTLSCSGLEGLWDAAGGNPEHAFMAAEIAMAESGGNQYALSPTDDLGYWQINASNGSLATYNALGNARSAIILSDDGTNWDAWTTYTEGLYAGRC
jgi:hypothetical protein